MFRTLCTRFAATFALVATTASTLLAPAAVQAREGNSMGHGVKCYYVLVSSINGVNTYKTVFRKGV